MRIAFLSVSSEMGGSEVCLAQLVAHIRRIDPSRELHVIVPRAGALARRTAAAGARVHVLPMPGALAAFGESSGRGLARQGGALLGAATASRAYCGRLRALLSDIRPDVVHTNGFKLHVLGRRSLPPATALVWHVHEFVGRRRLSRALMKHHLDAVSAVVANSDCVARDVVATLGADAPVRTICNGVDLVEFAPSGDVADLDALAGLPSPGTAVVRVGLVGTFGRWKGHQVFLRAIARLPAASPIRAYIVGGPLYETTGSQYSRAEVEGSVRELGLDGRVGFTGFVEHVAPVLRALDVVVHASTQPEPFGLVIAEGMACGRAVIASAAGGAGEIVRAGVDALTHAPGDEDGLAAAIGALVANPARREALGRAARTAAEARFDARRTAASFMSLYDAVAAVHAV